MTRASRRSGGRVTSGSVVVVDTSGPRRDAVSEDEHQLAIRVFGALGGDGVLRNEVVHPRGELPQLAVGDCYPRVGAEGRPDPCLAVVTTHAEPLLDLRDLVGEVLLFGGAGDKLSDR